MPANHRLAASLGVAAGLLTVCTGASALGADAGDAQGTTGTGRVGPLATMAGSSAGTSEISSVTTVAGAQAMARRPPLICDRCLRTQLISVMVAPLRSKARLRSCFCASVMPSAGMLSSAEPPPEIRQITRSDGCRPAVICSMRCAACWPAASGTGCAASTTSIDRQCTPCP